MQVDYVGRGLQITDEVRDYVASKLESAHRFLEEPVEIHVMLEEEGHRQIAEIHVHHRFGSLQAEKETDDLRQSIHDAVEKIEKQARRSRKKYMDRRRKEDRKRVHEWPVEVVERDSVGGREEVRIIKRSSLTIEPMTMEEAAARLEDASNDFVVFRDAALGQINVLYKRRDGHYGLISPEA